ncbi:hypothetical protein [Streptomyces sioyaensis]|uniref:hypothetical protein n=1 Tax=Streptomyces sioyaensis TaxID=67364 RepID=UPI003789224E
MDEHPLAVPAPPLRPYVSGYAGYRQAGVPPGRHRGLPSPRLTLIFTLDEPLTLAGHPDPAQAPGTYSALLGGLHTRPAMITHQGVSPRSPWISLRRLVPCIARRSVSLGLGVRG